jgi:hypothetical protein
MQIRGSATAGRMLIIDQIARVAVLGKTAKPGIDRCTSGSIPVVSALAYHFGCLGRRNNLANRFGRTFRHRSAHIQMSACPHNLGAAYADQQIMPLQTSRKVSGRTELGIDVEPNDVCLHLWWIKPKAIGLTNGCSNQLGILVILAQSIDVMFNGI